MLRTHDAGTLRAYDAGTTATLAGWVDRRRDHGGVVFLDLRDATGLVQVVVDPSSAGGADAHRVRSEYVLRVEGVVRPRPAGTVNADLPPLTDSQLSDLERVYDTHVRAHVHDRW